MIYRLFIQYELSIPLTAMQAAISVYTLHYFRDTPYPFGGWRNYLLGLCGCVTYLFGLRLFTLEGSWPIEWLVGDYYEQMYLTMLTFHTSVTVLIKALVTWLKTRRSRH